MRIVLLGPPGAGKGSVALLCKTRLRLPHLSTGQIFREEMAKRSPLGRRVGAYVTGGRLVPDALVTRVMVNRLTSKPHRAFVLDGFPRTQGQAAGLDRALERLRLPLHGAVYITSPEALLVRRLSGRLVCSTCGANYHARTMRPKRPGVCDRCHGALATRKDDRIETIRRRLAIDRRTSKPLLAYYQRRKALYRVDGRGRIETVFVRARRLFHRQGWI
ncbi:MAG: nucleoside monophosphate kinase [Candidatus Omnitrophica bacterium]|nr:nucleoside monophosphate kinase [Candidatus Omnitrophota bacterium]